MTYADFLTKINNWREKRISARNFIIVTALIVGLVAGSAAVLLKVIVINMQRYLQTVLSHHNYTILLFLFPIVGILLTVFYVQRFRGGKLGRGVSNILIAIARKSSVIEKDKTYTHIITSALTVGFGGSAGLEAPIVVTGAAIGSNTANDLRLGQRERTLMLACGVAAGIAAIFNSPIAGVLFAAEVILTEFSIPFFIPLLIASATASVLSSFLFNERLFFLITKGWEFRALPFYILLGIISGLMSVYITRMSVSIEGRLKKWKKPYMKAIVAGSGLGLLIFLLPPLFGEGYFTIEFLLSGKYGDLVNNSPFIGWAGTPWLILLFAVVIIFIKVIATSLTIGGGGNGGIFAPSLFIGGMTGFAFAYLMKLAGIIELTTPNFIVAGMAGALSGVVHAPLTAIFLIAEITGGYVLFVPLMIVSALSYFIARYFEPHSIYARVLVAKGLHKRDRDANVLKRIKLRNMIETDFSPVTVTETLGELVDKIAHTKRNIFPVLDENGKLVGLVLLDNIREIMFNTELYDTTTMRDLMVKPPVVLNIDDEMANVLKKFERHHTWNLAVEEDGKYAGFVSKSAVFSRYRALLLKDQRKSEETLY